MWVSVFVGPACARACAREVRKTLTDSPHSPPGHRWLWYWRGALTIEAWLGANANRDRSPSSPGSHPALPQALFGSGGVSPHQPTHCPQRSHTAFPQALLKCNSRRNPRARRRLAPLSILTGQKNDVCRRERGGGRHTPTLFQAIGCSDSVYGYTIDRSGQSLPRHLRQLNPGVSSGWPNWLIRRWIARRRPAAWRIRRPRDATCTCLPAPSACRT